MLKKIKTTSKGLVLAIFSIILLTSCSKTNSYNDNVIASVNNKTISKDLYSKELKFYQSYYSKVYGENFLNEKNDRGKTNDEVLREDLVDSMIKDQVMLNNLEKHKIKLDDNKSNELKKLISDKLNGDDSLKANIKALGVNENTFNDIIYNDSIRKAHYELFLKINKIKDSDVLEFYKKNKYLQKLYKYNALVFEDEQEAKIIRDSIKDTNDFKSYINKSVRNFSVINSDFVYNKDELLSLSKLKNKDKVSDIIKYKNKYYILMINSFNENENELLLRAKDIYLENSYETYLDKLVKESNIKLFVWGKLAISLLLMYNLS